MSDAFAKSDPTRRVPAWHERWLLLLRLYPELGAEYPRLLGFWLRRGDDFWQYLLRVEESRLLREAVGRGDACLLGRPTSAPRPGAWRDD